MSAALGLIALGGVSAGLVGEAIPARIGVGALGGILIGMALLAFLALRRPVQP